MTKPRDPLKESPKAFQAYSLPGFPLDIIAFFNKERRANRDPWNDVSQEDIDNSPFELTNFLEVPVLVNGNLYPSPEVALHAAKIDAGDNVHKVSKEARKKYLDGLRGLTPAEALKYAARAVPRKEGYKDQEWHSHKYQDGGVEVVKAKCNPYPSLKWMMAQLGGTFIVEDSPHDDSWGLGPKGRGYNFLGAANMQYISQEIIRNKLTLDEYLTLLLDKKGIQDLDKHIAEFCDKNKIDFNDARFDLGQLELKGGKSLDLDASHKQVANGPGETFFKLQRLFRICLLLAEMKKRQLKSLDELDEIQAKPDYIRPHVQAVATKDVKKDYMWPSMPNDRILVSAHCVPMKPFRLGKPENDFRAKPRGLLGRILSGIIVLLLSPIILIAVSAFWAYRGIRWVFGKIAGLFGNKGKADKVARTSIDNPFSHADQAVDSDTAELRLVDKRAQSPSLSDSSSSSHSVDAEVSAQASSSPVEKEALSKSPSNGSLDEAFQEAKAQAQSLGSASAETRDEIGDAAVPDVNADEVVVSGASPILS